MNIDHIGVAVKSIDDGIDFWTSVFGYQQATDIIINTRQKVKVAFLQKNNSIDIKLIEPVDDTSPISAFTQKGGGLHHICFKCNQIDDELPLLKESGMRVVALPQPGEAFENENIAFVYGKGLNIELIDTDKKAGRIV